MIIAVTVAILLTMALALVRALKGPSVFDRIVAVNMVGTKTVLLIALVAYATGQTDYIDITLLYALINFVAIIAVLRLIEQGGLGRLLNNEDGES